MKEMTVKEMYTLEETIAKDLFEGVTYPWKCDRRRRCSCRKFYRTEKCGPLQ